MAFDEAPAATTVASTDRECDRTEINSASKPLQFPTNGPASLVAAEIRLGPKRVGIGDDWLQCNIQVACHAEWHKISS